MRFTLKGATADATITLLNPLPVITSTSPSALTTGNRVILIRGSGFLPESQVLQNGVAVPTHYAGAGLLQVTLNLPLNGATSVALQVSNPAPGSASTDLFSLPVSVGSLAVNPGTLAAGSVSITATIASGVPNNGLLSIDGQPAKITARTATTITATGFLAPWKTGTTQVTLYDPTQTLASVTVPITPAPFPYDTAARFIAQAGFGPRADLIQHVQQVGPEAFVDEQLQVTPDPYNLVEQSRTHFLRDTLMGNDILRKRAAWALQTFLPANGISQSFSVMPWETTLEAHAFGSYRQLMMDTATLYGPASLLNLPFNYASSNPNVHPNQNYARELLQLFSLGTTLLNEDGTPKLDAQGRIQPTYDQDTVIAISRAMTGWTTPVPVNPSFTFYYVDFSTPLRAIESYHDQGSKVIFGNITIPAGQTAARDREMVMDAVFQHPNLPPFISRLMIQRLVKSQPSPAYVGRIARVFKDDGKGVRGNMGAVIKAILLDPEARAGDTGVSSKDDGFVQEPLYAQISMMSTLELTNFDDQPIYFPTAFGVPFWYATNVFSYFSPSYKIPGTEINSPEFQLVNNISTVQRSQFLWGVVTGTQNGMPRNAPQSSLFAHFTTLPAMLDALNHTLFHGTMPQSTRDAIMAVCSNIPDQKTQLQYAVFLAMNSDYNNVVR